MLTDAKIKSLKIENGERHADRDGLSAGDKTKWKEGIHFSHSMGKETANNHLRSLSKLKPDRWQNQSHVTSRLTQ